jgi:hypothetical protein
VVPGPADRVIDEALTEIVELDAGGTRSVRQK